ncbi:hypothetical protein [Pseudomonas nitroreducens]|nr:hypothetical protein [Pseudomonas nitroreducens]
MADEYIYDVHHYSRDVDGELICRCPHCQSVRGLGFYDAEEILGEQFSCHCGGMYQVDSEARRIPTTSDLPPNKGAPG